MTFQKSVTSYGWIQTAVGRATLFTALVVAGYISWLFSRYHDPEIESAISLFLLNLPNVFFNLFAFRIIRRRDIHPQVRKSWIIFLIASTILILADVLFIVWNRPVVSFADVLYVAYYILTLFGILTLPFIPLSRHERAMLALDLGIVLTASVMVLWYFMVGPVTAWFHGNLRDLVNLAYPLFDILLMAGAVTLVQRDVENVPRRTLLFIASANIVLVLADITYAYYAVTEAPMLLNTYNSLLICARLMLLFAVAAQSMAIGIIDKPQLQQRVSTARRMLRLTLPYLATAFGLALFVLAVETTLPSDLRLQGIFVGVVALAGCVLLRLHLVLRENVSLYEGAEQARQAAEQHRAEAERQREVAVRATAVAEEANRAKSQFLSNMSHELRTPLNAITGYSEMLQEEAQDLGNDSMIPDLHKIQAASRHLLSLISDILDLSKIEAGRMELYCETFELSAIIEEVATTVYPLVQKNSNQLEVRASKTLGSIYADETKVRQILFNLVSNACKFTKEGKILLDAQQEQRQGEPWVVFRVQDSGIGMTREQISRLFQAFMQADNSTSRRFGGTGLGLVISERFAQMMGGSIEVQSELGMGTTFIVRLPQRQEIPQIPAPTEKVRI